MFFLRFKKFSQNFFSFFQHSLSPLITMAAADQSLRKLGIEDLDLNGKRVFMRVDFNVPMKVHLAPLSASWSYHEQVF